MCGNIKKYLLEGFAIAFASKLLLRNSIDLKELLMLTLTITLTMFLLDKFAPNVSQGARQGTGFGLGYNLVGGGGDDGSNGDSEPEPANLESDCDYEALSEKTEEKEETNNQIVDRNPQVDILSRQKTDREIMGLGSSEQALLEGFSGGSADNSSIYNNYSSGPGVTASQQGLVYGKLSEEPSKGHMARIKQTVYSGDLLSLKVGVNKLVLLNGSDFIRTSTDPGANDRLIKFRIVLANGHKVDKLVPLNYRNAVYLIFTDKNSHPRKLNHNGNLNSLEASDRYTVFELIDSLNVRNKGIVDFSNSIYIKRSVEGESLVYLSEDTKNKKVTVNSSAENASTFTMTPLKGCGPLWKFDSDSRATNLFNSMQIRDIVDARTLSINNQMQVLRNENEILRGQNGLTTDQEINMVDFLPPDAPQELVLPESENDFLPTDAIPKELSIGQQINKKASDDNLPIPHEEEKFSLYELITSGSTPPVISEEDCKVYANSIGATYGKNNKNPGPGCVVTSDKAHVRYNSGACQHPTNCDCSPNNMCVKRI